MAPQIVFVNESILTKRIPELDPLRNLISDLNALGVRIHSFELRDEVRGKQPLRVVLHCKNLPSRARRRSFTSLRLSEFVEAQARYQRAVSEALQRAGWRKPEHGLVSASARTRSVTVPVPVRKSLVEWFFLQEYGAMRARSR
ncbi:MAG: hypothetical protein QW343_04055 [Candidatus Norongarragalinales archaeon]